jgi:putative membrane protein
MRCDTWDGTMSGDWRTKGADPDARFSLANERTFLAWIRTSLALLAGAVGVAQFATDLGPAWARRVVGGMLAVAGFAMAATAYRRWRNNEVAMRLGLPLPMTSALLIVAAAMSFVALSVVLLVVLG